MRRIGDRWELVNARHFGREVVVHWWPARQHHEAFAHCHRLNGLPDEGRQAASR